jgi:hypothetical protein
MITDQLARQVDEAAGDVLQNEGKSVSQRRTWNANATGNAADCLCT